MKLFVSVGTDIWKLCGVCCFLLWKWDNDLVKRVFIEVARERGWVSLRQCLTEEQAFIFSAFVSGAWETMFLLLWKSSGILSDIFLTLPTFPFSWTISFKDLFCSAKQTHHLKTKGTWLLSAALVICWLCKGKACLSEKDSLRNSTRGTCDHYQWLVNILSLDICKYSRNSALVPCADSTGCCGEHSPGFSFVLTCVF